MTKPTVAELRAKHGLSQRDLAEMSGVRQVTISHHESGVRPLSAKAREQIAAAFSIGIDDVQWEVAKPDPKVVFEVRGHTGERDDAQSWSAGVFPSQASAAARCARAEKWLDEHLMLWGGPVIAPWIERNAVDCPFDPNFVCDYTGTRYEVVPVLLAH